MTAAPSAEKQLGIELSRRSLPNRTLYFFIGSVVAIFGMAGLLFYALNEQVASGKSVIRTLGILQQIEAIGSSLKDAETGQRGYLLTSRDSYLDPYEQAIRSLPQELDRLTAATMDNSRQQERLRRARLLISSKLAELAHTIEQKKSGRAGEAMTTVLTDRGKGYMDELRGVLTALEEEELGLLESRIKERQKTVLFSTVSVIAGLTALLLIVISGAQTTASDFRSRNIEAWIRAGEAALAVRIFDARTIDLLSQRIVDFMVGILGAKVGALYIKQSDGRLHRTGTAGLPAAAPVECGAGEGLVGRACVQGQTIEITDAPPSYLRVESATMQGKVAAALIAPGQVDNQVNSVLELGFLRPLEAHDRLFVERILAVVGRAIQSAQYRAQLEALLQETQRQAEELQTQQEELRVTNEELEEQGRALRESHAQLQNQQAEVEQTNSQLEEQAQILESQKTFLMEAQATLRKKQEELERSNQYKSEFLANMSHELRTPLNSSMILARLLADNKSANLTAEQVKFAETIYSAGHDLLNLINDILDLSKIEAGKLELRPSQVVLADLSRTLSQTFSPIANQRNLQLTITLDPAVSRVIVTDGQRLEQILKNLLSNALKFTEQGGVTLRVSAPSEKEVAFAVEDTGIGIRQENLQLIFETFRQIDSASNRKYGGTGLGLSISRNLAHLLGGDLTVQSREGAGSTFTLTIKRQLAASSELGAVRSPQRLEPESPGSTLGRISRQLYRLGPAAPAASAAVWSPAGEAASASSSRLLLVIEDDSTFAELLCKLGRELGYECVIAPGADAGFKVATTRSPSAIILDIGLPDHSGLSVLDRLKRNSKTRHIPVHVISGHDHAQTALEMGAVGYALKPVEPENLVAALKRLSAKATQTVRRVLVVEDDARQRESVCHLLASEGVETIPVETATAALRYLKSSPIDCVVMDLKLPDGSGDDVLEKLAAEANFALPPVIIYTGRELSRQEEDRLRRHSKSIIIKGARSPERLLDEVTLFLHQVESELPPERQRMLVTARDREALFADRVILIVEDDVRNIFALNSVLEPKGAKIEIARNGREALAKLESLKKVDLVLMDIMMPEMDGFEALHRIRAQPKWEKLPVIALTAKAMRDDHERCLKAGANDYVSKPIEVDKLLSLIRVWMPK